MQVRPVLVPVGRTESMLLGVMTGLLTGTGEQTDKKKSSELFLRSLAEFSSNECNY